MTPRLERLLASAGGWLLGSTAPAGVGALAAAGKS
jgi:hypothetical protein